tara:strand:+ start:1059 stop:1370 length:312 start_codon:yes stop_codon:yes gene_type:complete
MTKEEMTQWLDRCSDHVMEAMKAFPQPWDMDGFHDLPEGQKALLRARRLEVLASLYTAWETLYGYQLQLSDDQPQTWGVFYSMLKKLEGIDECPESGEEDEDE